PRGRRRPTCAKPANARRRLQPSPRPLWESIDSQRLAVGLPQGGVAWAASLPRWRRLTALETAVATVRGAVRHQPTTSRRAQPVFLHGLLEAGVLAQRRKPARGLQFPGP